MITGIAILGGLVVLAGLLLSIFKLLKKAGLDEIELQYKNDWIARQRRIADKQNKVKQMYEARMRNTPDNWDDVTRVQSKKN